MGGIGPGVVIGPAEVPTLAGAGAKLRAGESMHRGSDRPIAIGEDQLAGGGHHPTCQRAKCGPEERDDRRADGRAERRADGSAGRGCGGLRPFSAKVETACSSVFSAVFGSV
jgi:hypothetical protein